MGTSIAMIDLHYGHLAVDSYQHAVSLLDALALEAGGGRWVDVGSQARKAAQRLGFQASGGVRGGPWTLGGRQGLNPSLPDPTEGPD
jgi:hypothetical protein